MSKTRSIVALLLSSTLGTAACGTYVPRLEEPVTSEPEGQNLIRSIVVNIDCEIRNAINEVIARDIADVRDGVATARRTEWLERWGVQSTLNLQASERSTANPSIDWFPPISANFSLGANANLSAEASRENKIGSYYTIQEILQRGPCSPASRSNGLFMLQNDLKLAEWLYKVVMIDRMEIAPIPHDKSSPVGQDVITHHITFEVVSGGGLTPSWRLAEANINQGGTFLGASRTRKHDLALTLGPADPALLTLPKTGTRAYAQRAMTKAARGAAAAANAHLATEIGVAVSNALRASR